MAQLKDTLIAGDLRVTGTIYGINNNAADTDHTHGVITNSGYVGTTSNQALYTGTSGVITSGTLPIAAGGTGATSASAAWTALGGGASGKHADSYFALASHGNHVPTTQTANNAVFLRNDNTWQTVTAANIGAAASTHSHGSITSAGAITTTVTIATGDKLVITDSSDSSKLKASGISFGTTTASFLSNDGTWKQPAKYGTSLPSSGDFVGQIFVLTE